MLHERPSKSSKSKKKDPLSEPDVLQEEFNRFEELIFQSDRIPLTQWILVNERQLLDRLESLRENWPEAFKKAMEIIQQEQETIAEAEAYAENIIQQAQQQAARILDETGIVQQASMEAQSIRQQTELECRSLQQQTIAEIEQMRSQALQEIEEIRQTALAECEAIENGADLYAEDVLEKLEGQLSQMLKVVRNGRRQLNENPQQAPRSH